MEWDAEKYDRKHDFVFEYGSKLLDYLPEKFNRILDIGCGTGELTAEIAQKGYEVKGIDQSINMIQKAKQNFPDINFTHENFLSMSLEKDSFDTVFSNAVFHWITNQQELVERIHTILKPNGLLICEFGAHGNIELISKAFDDELNNLGIEYHSPFYFPTVTEYTYLLKQNNFKIIKAYDYSRPTILKDGYSGMRNWIYQFFATDLKKIDNPSQLFNRLEKRLEKDLWKGDHWEADYRRIRIVAEKI